VEVFFSNSFASDIAIEREVEGDLFHQDMGQGVGFRPGTFDGTKLACDQVWFPSAYC